MVIVKTNWLNAATSTGATASEEVTGVATYVVQASATGSPSDARVVLEGSVDGTNWVALATAQAASGGQIIWDTGQPVKSIRLNLTVLSGGSSPAVSASVMAI